MGKHRLTPSKTTKTYTAVRSSDKNLEILTFFSSESDLNHDYSHRRCCATLGDARTEVGQQMWSPYPMFICG